MIYGSVALKGFAKRCGIPYKQVNPASIDLTLAKKYLIRTKSLFQDTEGEFDGELGILLRPGELLLVSTRERLSLNPGETGFVRLKSSAARRGLSWCVSGLVDPGWDGVLTMAVYAPVAPVQIMHAQSLFQVSIFTTGPGFTYGSPEAPVAHYQGSRSVTPAFGED